MLMPMLATAPITFGSAFLQTLATSTLVGAVNITLLQKIYPGARSSLIGTYLKIIITPPTTGSMVINAAYVGFPNGSVSTAVGYDTAQVPLTWNGGSAGGTWTLAGPNPEPDEIAFAIPDQTKALIFAFNIALSGTYMRRDTLGSNYASYLKAAGAQEAANSAKSGYAGTSGRLAIISQLLIGA